MLTTIYSFLKSIVPWRPVATFHQGRARREHTGSGAMLAGRNCQESRAAYRSTRRKICMIAYTDYESDNRVRRYAETLARRGDFVDVISLSTAQADQPETQLNGVTIHHLFRRYYNESSPWSYAIRQLRFLFRASVTVARLHQRKRYDIVHIHNMPDFLVFAAWYPRLTGTKLILDIHDIIPELFGAKFRSRFTRFYVATLRVVERVSAGFVDHVIVSNHLWRDKLIARSVDEARCSILVNHVDPQVFMRRQRARNDGKFVVLFPGSFQWHQGLDIGIRAFSHFRRTVPNAEFHLYGGGSERIEAVLKALARELEVEDSVKFFGSFSLDDIVQVIADSDLGVVPKRADSFGNEAYSTKIMEFMSQGVPVVVSRTKVDSYYFSEDDVHFFPSGDSNAMAKAMCEVAENPDLRESLIAHGLEYVAQNSWARKQEDYLNLVDGLCTGQFYSRPKRDLVPAAER